MLGRVSSLLACLALLCLIANPVLADARITTEEVKVYHNVYRDNVKGMTIHLRFTAFGLLGTDCNAIAYFYWADGRKLPGNYGKYHTQDGQVSTSAVLRPKYGRAEFKSFELFLPYAALSFQGAGKADLKFHVEYVVKSDGTRLGSSKSTSFTYSR